MLTSCTVLLISQCVFQFIHVFKFLLCSQWFVTEMWLVAIYIVKAYALFGSSMVELPYSPSVCCFADISVFSNSFIYSLVSCLVHCQWCGCLVTEMWLLLNTELKHLLFEL